MTAQPTKTMAEVIESSVPLRFAFVKITVTHKEAALLEFTLHEPIVPIQKGDGVSCGAGEFVVTDVTHRLEWSGSFSMIQHLDIQVRPRANSAKQQPRRQLHRDPDVASTEPK